MTARCLAGPERARSKYVKYMLVTDVQNHPKYSDQKSKPPPIHPVLLKLLLSKHGLSHCSLCLSQPPFTT